MNADSLSDARVLVTGAAGFIGHAVANALLDRGAEVFGTDNLCEAYYAAALKRMRLETLTGREGFTFTEAELTDETAIGALFTEADPTHVVHLAAHAAVMPSFAEPVPYVSANVIGTQVMLEAARSAKSLRRMVYASTSSVYGSAKGERPFREDQPTTTPISVYGASKVANEAMAQAYYTQYGLPLVGLRFFKVYGPWGRPDTVFFKFMERVHRGEPVRLHNHGDIYHAFTYIDDIVGGVLGALTGRPQPDADGRHPIYNLGNPDSQQLGHCLDLIEEALGREAVRELVPLPKGDRFFSIADVSRAQTDLGYEVRVPVEEGIPNLVRWYLETCAPHDRRWG
ncbi:NAD-dependent epimerase/dehydratase family protein [Parvularcula dongshanensis]|uniref:UDP-glucuronate 4-epimerase n=1 Tax=Parvularcula dongshanensis TaxID=1173995 RepID=A0A840I416_9PROT|nr:NAD-dependent epimerase/dehydratase family protein [Parvularcula dongshanensis]MBB4659075.1 UDP-glucuronate 4-epimerase [Parvularcula dongshanensis]